VAPREPLDPIVVNRNVITVVGSGNGICVRKEKERECKYADKYVQVGKSRQYQWCVRAKTGLLASYPGQLDEKNCGVWPHIFVSTVY
jgi:hypothetical protein